MTSMYLKDWKDLDIQKEVCNRIWTIIIRLDISPSNIPEQISNCRLPKCRLRDEVSAELSDVDRRHRLSTMSKRTAVKTCWRWGCTSCPRSTWVRCDLRVLSSPSQFTQTRTQIMKLFSDTKRHKISIPKLGINFRHKTQPASLKQDLQIVEKK